MYSTMDEVNQERRERMNESTGTVGKMSERQWKNLVFHSFTLEEGDEWFGMGTETPNFREGDTVNFRWENDKKGYPAVKGKVRATSANVGTSAPAEVSSAPTNTGSAGTNPVVGGLSPKDKRYQEIDVPRMSFSAAQERAVTLVSAALANDALSFGTAAKGKRLDVLLSFVDTVTDRFFLQAIEAPEHLIDVKEQRDQVIGSTNEDEFTDD